MKPVTSYEAVVEVLGVAKSSHLEAAYKAAEGAVAACCRWPEVDGAGQNLEPPAALVEAVALRTSRYLARRESPAGVVGFGDLGPIRISSVDRDIEELEGPYRRVVFG